MKAGLLENIEKTFFSAEDIAAALNISTDSAPVSAYRYCRQGFLVRIRPDLYVRKDRWRYFDKNELFMAANLIQVPSYISLASALEYYGITTQMQRDFVESVSPVRSARKEINGKVFRYSKISGRLYFGFEKKNNIYIASAEKALADVLYLYSIGRYSADFDAVDGSGIDRKRLLEILTKYPEKTRKAAEIHGFIR
jgi:predicted transcriptional regulator of viral defense system